MTHSCCIVVPLLPASMPVQELDICRRQRLWHHNPGVQDLASCHTHHCCVSMLPSGWSQDLPDGRWCIWLIATAYQQSCTSQQDVESQTGVPVLRPAMQFTIIRFSLLKKMNYALPYGELIAHYYGADTRGAEEEKDDTAV